MLAPQFLVLATLALAAPLPHQAPAPEPAHASLVLVTIDTLRREHLGCYGYPRPTSPRIDQLAAQSVLFERAFASMATTFPSHLSMLTGLYPHQHGHTSNRGAAIEPYRPAEGRLSLAGALAAAGTHTGAFVSSVVLHERTGIGAGFDVYEGPKIKEGKRGARATMQRALEWLAGLPAGAPFFLWVHLWDVHEPNEPEPAFAQLLAPDETLTQWLAGRALDLPALAAEFGDDEDVGLRFFGRTERIKSPAERKRPPKFLRPADVKRAQKFEPTTIDQQTLLELYARYDACIREVDAEVGRLIDALTARGAWSETAFVFSSDHGQSLGDNAFFGHGRNTQINTAVPLLIRFPASAGVSAQRSRALVSVVDLAPTLLAHLRLGSLGGFEQQLVGADVLAPGFARERVFTSEATEFHKGGTRPFSCALLSGRWKYGRTVDGTGALYDLEGAGEGIDVGPANEDVVAELERILAAELESSILGEEPGRALEGEDEELLKQLEQLGYGGDGDGDNEEE